MLYHSLLDWFAFTTFPLPMRKRSVGPWTLLNTPNEPKLRADGHWDMQTIAEHEIVNNLWASSSSTIASRYTSRRSLPEAKLDVESLVFTRWTKSRTRLAWKTTYLSRTTQSVTNHPIKYGNSQCNICLCINAISGQTYVKESRTQLSKSNIYQPYRTSQVCQVSWWSTLPPSPLTSIKRLQTWVVLFRALNMMAGPNFCSSESQLNRSILYSKLCKEKAQKGSKRCWRGCPTLLYRRSWYFAKSKNPSLLPLRIGHSHWASRNLRFRVDVLPLVCGKVQIFKEQCSMKQILNPENCQLQKLPVNLYLHWRKTPTTKGRCTWFTSPSSKEWPSG